MSVTPYVLFEASCIDLSSRGYNEGFEVWWLVCDEMFDPLRRGPSPALYNPARLRVRTNFLVSFLNYSAFDLVYKLVTRFRALGTSRHPEKGRLSLLGPLTAHVLNPCREGPGDIYPPHLCRKRRKRYQNAHKTAENMSKIEDELTRQNGQVGRPKPRSADQGQVDPDPVQAT
ncbi:hypothetical protein U9M48_003549 [Paspalum notatum var. saurae]|uniref:Uncharacterized protein n=1 Tax=Paspalum notatum var. saurae TaxID=547442 RepID=A0AAQ3PI21_PASNO